MPDREPVERHRPTAVLVMAILNLVFGGLGLVCYLCAGAGTVLAVNLLNKAAIPGGNPLTTMVEVFERHVPGYIAFLIGMMILSTIMAIILIIAGIGLLSMKPWARYLSIFYAVVTILTSIGGQVFNLAYVNPAMPAIQRELQEELSAPNQQRPGTVVFPSQQPANSPLSQGVGSIFGLVLGVAYSIALLIVMFHPTVTAAFAGKRAFAEDHFGERGDEPDRYDENKGEENGGSDPHNYGYRPRRPGGGGG